MRFSTRIIATAASAVFLVAGLSLYAESAARPAGIDEIASSSSAAAMPYSNGLNRGVPRFELFLGYSYLRAVPAYADGNRLVWLNGGSTSLAYNVNRHWGLVGDFGAYTNSQIHFTGGYTGTVDVNNSNVAVTSYLFGPRLSFRNHDRITPFAQVLFGGVHANLVTLAGCTVNCTVLPVQDSFAMTAGGGLDLRVHHHFAIRLIQAEYLMTRFASYTTGATGTQNDMRLSSGIVFRFGGRGAPQLPPLPPLAYSCSVSPASVFIGDPIMVSGTAVNLDPAKTAVYTWAADGGTVTGTSDTASIDTANAAPGAYMLKGHVSEGDRASDNADCTASYTVKAFEPPTVSCSADPAIVISGNPSTVTAIGISPQNRPLIYSYSSTSGVINGSAATAVLATGGVAVGSIAVTCNVADDKGQSATSTTMVTVAAPVAAPKPQTSDLCSIHFDRDARRPVRVDNEGKACLDGIALNLQQNSDASLAIVGNAASAEKDSRKLATQRAVNTKAYLVGEKGIDASRIAVYIGSQDGKVVTNTLIPAGATLDNTGNTPVD